MEKQFISQNVLRPENSSDIVDKFTNEILVASATRLVHISDQLKFICDEIDPYHCEQIPDEARKILAEYNLEDTLDNPFYFTNVILRFLDIAETELKKRLH